MLGSISITNGRAEPTAKIAIDSADEARLVLLDGRELPAGSGRGYDSLEVGPKAEEGKPPPPARRYVISAVLGGATKGAKVGPITVELSAASPTASVTL